MSITETPSRGAVRSTAALFAPFTLGGLSLPNRIAMAPMTRSHSPGGVPGADVAAYYRRRAEGGVGLIVTEGTYIPHDRAGFDPNVPGIASQAALDGWRRVVAEVHAAGGRIFSQLWHVGEQVTGGPAPAEGVTPVGAMMPVEEIRRVVAAYGEAAANAKAVGFDGVEIHAAHGYLIDQFFWDRKNRRTDAYGGDLVARTRFAVEVMQAIRERVGPGYPIAFRFSQWKIEDFDNQLARTPDELAAFLAPLSEAGVDIFHASTRRFWDVAFPQHDAQRTLAAWTKQVTGKPVIAVGSVTLSTDLMASFQSPETVSTTGIGALLDRMESGEFDLIAIGRSLIANPDWPALVRQGALERLKPFAREALTDLH